MVVQALPVERYNIGASKVPVRLDIWIHLKTAHMPAWFDPGNQAISKEIRTNKERRTCKGNQDEQSQGDTDDPLPYFFHGYTPFPFINLSPKDEGMIN
jgi:hypothetical protein